jgi:methionyl-tRNA synthetase
MTDKTNSDKNGRPEIAVGRPVSNGVSTKYYITTPIYYANAEPHVGTAYTTIAGDVLARYKKLCGHEVFYLTGTDEHGQKILRSATAAGLKPKEFVDSIVTQYKKTWSDLNIKYDHFIRTTDAKHEQAVQAIFTRIADAGDIYKGKYSGWYCTACERYINLKESPDKKCPVCQRPTEFFEEENYFFKLSKYQDKMLALLKSRKDFIEPTSRYNEILSRVEMGLDDVSVSRASFDWGITMPTDRTTASKISSLTSPVSVMWRTSRSPPAPAGFTLCTRERISRAPWSWILTQYFSKSLRGVRMSM